MIERPVLSDVDQIVPARAYGIVRLERCEKVFGRRKEHMPFRSDSGCPWRLGQDRVATLGQSDERGTECCQFGSDVGTEMRPRARDRLRYISVKRVAVGALLPCIDTARQLDPLHDLFCDNREWQHGREGVTTVEG